MRRIPWFAVAVLAGLAVVALPLASAQPVPQQLGAPGCTCRWSTRRCYPRRC
jgi:hypothetical protein